MMENIDFTSDEPSDQKGIMTSFDEENQERNLKRKAEDLDTKENKNGSQNG